jgi:hypothetical protein
MHTYIDERKKTRKRYEILWMRTREKENRELFKEQQHINEVKRLRNVCVC